MDTFKKAKLCLEVIQERKAIDPVLFQVAELSSVTDYFLIASGNSTRQVQSIARHVEMKMRAAGFRAYGIEGLEQGRWALMDYGDVVIHVFSESTREFYDLEGLWIEAPRIYPHDEKPGEVKG